MIVNAGEFPDDNGNGQKAVFGGIRGQRPADRHLVGQRHGTPQTLPVGDQIAIGCLFGKIHIQCGDVMRAYFAPVSIGKLADGLVDVSLDGFLESAQNFVINDVAAAVKGKPDARAFPVILRLPSFAADREKCSIMPVGGNLRPFVTQPEGQAS